MSNNKYSNTKTKTNPIASVYEWVEVVCVALLVVVILFTFVCRLVTVSGKSMMQTFYNNDKLIISDLFYEPKCGDVVVVQNINDPNFHGPIIKRIIATEGETVEIDSETWTVRVTDIYGNVRVLDEPYVNRTPGNMAVGAMIGKHTVAEGHVFVMGDNRNDSYDSRFCGDIDKRMILGKAYVRIFPSPTFDFSK